MTTEITREISLQLTIDVEKLQALLNLAVEPDTCRWARFVPSMNALGVLVVARDAEPLMAFVCAEDLARGLARLATSRTLPDAHAFLLDAVTASPMRRTADLVLQLTVFGEVLYG